MQAEMLAQLKRDDARILDELLDADDLVDDEERVSMDSIPLDDYRVAARTCGTNQFGFSKTSALRVRAFRLSQSPAFRNFILCVITRSSHTSPSSRNPTEHCTQQTEGQMVLWAKPSASIVFLSSARSDSSDDWLYRRWSSRARLAIAASYFLAKKASRSATIREAKDFDLVSSARAS